MAVEQNVWGFTPEGEAIVLYTLTNAAGAVVRLTNIGAGIVSVVVPDRDGRMADVALGYASPLSYMGDGAAMGKTPGRYANRIAGGRFTLDGVEYTLPQNSGPNTLHGGPQGFANRLWESRAEEERVVFSLVSPDGDQGFPGELGAEVVYEWTEDCRLEITYLAACDAPTVVNLTNHAYFNLAGEDAGSVLGHTLQLHAHRYLPTDRTQIPTGQMLPVGGTPMDFLVPKELGRDIDAPFEALEIGSGYDHCWIVDGYGVGDELLHVGTLTDPVSGRTLDILSTQPGVQVYTGNFLQGGPTAKGGRRYSNRDGVAIECQGLPDAPNRPGFPSQVLRPGETYCQKIEYRFGSGQ
ncbi:MAG: galactose mutarotase [Rikenellaceae bacterium]|nr:galactose mutarotase [Rikenellaceae bacterium]